MNPIHVPGGTFVGMPSTRLLAVALAAAALTTGMLTGGCRSSGEGGRRAEGRARLVLDGSALELTGSNRFASGAKILEGFDECRPGEEWASGDCILLGIAMDTPGASREWYLRVTALGHEFVRNQEGKAFALRDSVRVRYRGKEGEEHGAWVRVDYDLVPVRVELFDRDATLLSATVAMMPDLCLRHGMIDNIELERSGRGFYDSFAESEHGGQTARGAGEERVAGEEQKRFLAGWLALMKFPDFLHRKSMGGLLWQLIERPSLISIALSGGVSLGLSLDPKRAELVGDEERLAGAGPGLTGPVYRVPLHVEVNGSKALECEVLLARAVPPLGPGNGLLAIDAVNPRDAHKRITVRLLAARTVGAEALKP